MHKLMSSDMKIIISGKHMNIGESLKKHVKEHLSQIVIKYFKDAISGDVKISKEGNYFYSEIIVNEGTGNKTLVKSNSHEYDAYKSFNIACEKIEKQLRRYKSRITHHKKHKEKFEHLIGTKYVIEPLDEPDLDDKGDAPAIIAEKTTELEKLSVKDAVMRMDLLNLPALVFINSSTNDVNAVYYRKDSNISWIETHIPTKS